MTCTVASPRCPDAARYDVDLPTCCAQKIVETLETVGAMLDREGVPWWVDYGTVLGTARHSGLVPWDKDADIGILEEDLDRVLALEHRFRDLGHAFCYHPPKATEFDSGHWINIWRSRHNANGLDIFPWHERDGAMMHRLRYTDSDRCKGREFPRDRLFPLQRVPFEWIEVWAPADLEWFAQHRYGENWREPLRANNDGRSR